MDNKKIVSVLKQTMQLMELHEENAFKIRGYQSAINSIEREGKPLADLDTNQLQEFPGIGKSLAETIESIRQSGTHPQLEKLLKETPDGILEIMEIKGLGPKKIKILWRELEITSTHELMEACQSGQVAKIKGFGEKTQESIIQALEYKASNKGKWLYADIEAIAEDLQKLMEKIADKVWVAAVGPYGRMSEIVDGISFLIGTDQMESALKKIAAFDGLVEEPLLSSPYRWHGHWKEGNIPVTIFLTEKANFLRQKLLKTSSPDHLLTPLEDGHSLGQHFYQSSYTTEEDAYEKAGFSYIPPSLREGNGELDWIKSHSIGELLTENDLTGPLHNHSTYSDGRHSLKEMAEYCKEAGYGYLGIADHSKSAFYANGLDEDRILQQHKEIDAINESLAPFRIFKGIESDILIDGNLDYSPEVLASFDYIVASIHSGLNMDIKKATARLVKAIQNPYTTILGHPTGRLLLRREGYPIDHRAVIDACAEHEVVIEINANPWRLDLDWRWVRYAMEKGVMLSINPDAHEKKGVADMKYGVITGRKGGLTKTMTLNTKTTEELSQYFENRKRKIQ
ncbi:helix-hairpin-helix domain-containing protein [Cyclobacterium plantarum]|uniref:DNA polymerase/3'-5' exonuclease PolX n=1 Tax=Cyclobacterium plantarum TaxID=2716263 RepID=A0ABX0HHH3_9BACT|nr:helix-hairpin-helix domain-containing protein [Cyclobacterium plantarum]NHE59763.1 DNA polymerase/3'-5' exonuclease PolX [Cyclobacterium plantarum]